MKHGMRKFEGTTRLQGVGVVEGIRAINVRVGDRRVWNFGDSTEVIRVELSKTGKTVKITTKWFNKRARLEEGQWIGEWQEDTRTLKADTIVVVKELNPTTTEAKEVKEVTPVSSEAKEEVMEATTEVAEEKRINKKVSAYEKWLRTLIEEKGIYTDYEFTIEHNNQIHFMTLDFLISAILTSSEKEKKQIKNILVMIDFKNGDILHFLEHLAKAYIRCNY